MENDILVGQKNYLNNEFNYEYFGYKMLLSAFKGNNFHKGLQRALFFVKMYTQSSDIVLYKADRYDNYNYLCNGSIVLKNNEWISIFINKAKKLIESKKSFFLPCNDISSDKCVLFIPINSNSGKYIVAVKNSSLNNLQYDDKFIKIFSETFDVILNKLEYFDMVNKKSYIDEQTGLENRNSYEEVIKKLDASSDPYIYVLFDLFRLKYINDKYSYLLGDAYIFKTAEILKKYFPKYHTYHDKDGMIRKERTGSVVYKRGGDEFVLINKNESLDIIKAKVDMICKEVENIDLNVNERLNLGINYGIASRNNHETVKEIALIAGDNMKQDKTKMYQKYGLDRRK